MKLRWSVAVFACCSIEVAGLAGLPARSQTSSGAFTLTPIDEGSREPTFADFRRRLSEGIRRRDSQLLLDSSTEETRGLLLPGLEPGASAWLDLERVLLLGGSFTETRGRMVGRREFCAPYTYSAYPTRGVLNDIVPRLAGHDGNPEGDPWVILGERVRVRAAPSADARVLALVSHQLMIVTGDESPDSAVVQWREVYIDGNRTGWIGATFLRSYLDYRACFANLDGAWKMTIFARG